MTMDDPDRELASTSGGVGGGGGIATTSMTSLSSSSSSDPVDLVLDRLDSKNNQTVYETIVEVFI